MLKVNTFRALLEQGAQHFADRSFLIDDERLGPVSYADVARFASGLERRFEELQIPVGAPVATVFHNCGLAALFFLAVIASRRLLVPLNPTSTRDELSYMLDRARCAAVIADPTHTRSFDVGDRLAIRVVDHRDYFTSLCQRADSASVVREHDPVGDVPYVGEVVFTSGSTGRPKGVMLSERSLLANAEALAGVYGLESSDRFLTVCPLFHNSGQISTTLACALVGGSTAPVKSDVGMLHFWHYVAKYRAHWSLGMVSFLALLLSRKEPAEPGTEMRGLLTGGSAIDTGLIQAFEARFGVPVRTVYGLTESASIATCEFRDASPRSPGSSGRPLPIVDVRIRSDRGALAPSHDRASRQRGEVWISGPTIFDGYVGDPELTRARMSGNWLQTGDLGYFDDNGNLFIVDRLDSMLIVGGENVYPAEVERLATRLPGAAQVVLAGVDHKIWGKELVLVYKAPAGVRPETRMWRTILAEHLAAFKVPQRYVPIEELGVEEFPRRENGKLDRQALAALLKSRYTPVLHGDSKEK